MDYTDPRITAAIFKRMIDVAVATILLLFLIPLMSLVALFIFIKHGPPILFVQMRPGIFGKPFSIYKFRSMTVGIGEETDLETDRQRLTKFGTFLRSTSLDELPELFNVLKGDMSLVGPRPLLMQYLPRYTSEQMRRHEVKPGITGWAQINGRNAISWEEKFVLDVWYVDHMSFWLDIKIIFLTIINIIRRENINQPGHATMEEFKGGNTK